MFGLSGELVAQPGRGDELEAILLRAAAALDTEPSCRLYVVSRVEGISDRVHVTEVWRDEAAHRSSLELPAVQALVQEARPVMAGVGERRALQPLGGKGL
jgi:quinol monooxygenase YgiN